MNTPTNPCIIMESEKAPEVSTLVQPNSVNTGLKKTPKLEYVPKLAARIQKAATAIT